MIYKRGHKCWYRFKWTVKLPDGTRENHLIQRSSRTGNKQKAREVEEEHRRALRLGQVHPSDPWPPVRPPAVPTIRVFSDQFLAYARIHTKPGTSRFYKACVANLLRFSPLADCCLNSVRGELASKYVRWRQAFLKPPSVQRINGELRTLRRMLNLAHDWAITENSPAIHELPGASGRDHVVSFEDEARYLTLASSNLRDLAILAIDTGLRPDELFSLKWENVELEPSKELPNGFIHVVSGKTENAVRNIPLTERAKEVLMRHKQEKSGSKFVFPGDGKTGHIVTVQHAHERAIEKSKLAYFQFYCWRHTFGTRMAESGVDKFALARLMGHSSPTVAERYYIHVTEPYVTAGFEKFENYQKAMVLLAKKKIESFPQQTEKVQ